MEERLRLYRLALALVPDADAAGDIFMASRSESGLRRRAARWRDQQGLPPATGTLPLVSLTEEQREHALHLDRRGTAHRRITRWLTVPAVLLGLAAGGYWLRDTLTPRLDSHPAFAGQPFVRMPGMGDLTLSIYRVEQTGGGRPAEPMRTTIWWEVTGPGASDAYRLFNPQVHVLDLGARRDPPFPSSWVHATSTQRYSTRPDRLLGVSRFETQVLMAQVTFRLKEGRGTEPDFGVIFRNPALKER